MMQKIKAFMFKMPMMMTCREFEEFIDDYFDNKLPRWQHIKFAMHLKVCRDCRSYLKAYKLTKALGKKVFEDPDGELPPDIPEDLIEAILDSKEE